MLKHSKTQSQTCDKCRPIGNLVSETFLAAFLQMSPQGRHILAGESRSIVSTAVPFTGGSGWSSIWFRMHGLASSRIPFEGWSLD
jgi:hypothetical protein